MEALKTTLIDVLRTNYNVAVKLIAFVIRTMQLNSRFQSPLSPSEFNKLLTEIYTNAPDNEKEMAKMIISLVVHTSVSSQKDGLMVVNNDKELLDRFLDSLYTDSSTKDDSLIKKTKYQVVLALKQDNNIAQDSQDDEDQQYSDDEFEPESPNRLNRSTDNEISKYLNIYNDEFDDENSVSNDAKRGIKKDNNEEEENFNRLLSETTNSMRQSLISQGISIKSGANIEEKNTNIPPKVVKEENAGHENDEDAKVEAQFEVIRRESMIRKITPSLVITTDILASSINNNISSPSLLPEDATSENYGENVPQTSSNLKISFTSPSLDGKSDMLMIKMVEIDDNSVVKIDSNDDLDPRPTAAHHSHLHNSVGHHSHVHNSVGHHSHLHSVGLEATPSKRHFSVFARRPTDFQHTNDFATILRPCSSGAMHDGKKIADKKSKMIDPFLYSLQELVHAKAKDAKKLIGFGDNYWREKLFMELEDNIEALKLKHEQDLASTKIRYKLGGYEYKSRCADAVDEISDVRYKNIRSKLLVQHKEEIQRMAESITVPLIKLDDVILLQTDSINVSLSKADEAMAHYVKLAESHKGRTNNLATLRLKSAKSATRIAFQAALKVVEAICKKIMTNYKGVSTHNGPIHTSLPLKTRIGSAKHLKKCDYPKCVVGDRRLPTLPSEAKYPPNTLNLIYYKKKLALKHRPKSAPSGDTNTLKKKKHRQMPRPQSATATAIHARRHNHQNPNYEFLADSINQNLFTNSHIVMGLTPADVGVETTNVTVPITNETGATIDDEYRYDDDFYRDDGFIQGENYADDTFEQEDMIMYDPFDYDSQIGDAPIFDDYNDGEKFERKKYKLKRKKKSKKKRINRTEDESFPSQDVQNSKATRDSNIGSALTGTDVGTNSSYPWNENPCGYCERSYRGIGKTLPTPFTLDKKITSKVRIAHQALIGGLKANREKLTSRQLRDLKYTEHLRNKYHIEYPKVEEFCSWKCVKCYMKLKVPLQHQYEYSVLIDLTAGKLIE